MNSNSGSPEFKMKPRSYQLQLLDHVMERNAIVYLPTGAGKTYVAILALRRFSHVMQRPIEEGGKRAIYMCNTIELARQQAFEVRKNTNLNVGFYIGEREVDSWNRKRWHDEIREHQVLVGTAQIFVDIVTQNHLKITDLCVVIIDECHHTTKNHPMHEFMRLFQHCNESLLPRVIGLTGVLLKGNFNTKRTIGDVLANLETTFRGTIITVKSAEQYNNVMLFSTKPQEELITYESNAPYIPLFDQIKNQIAKTSNAIDLFEIGQNARMSKGLNQQRLPSKKTNIKNLLNDFLYQMTEFGVYASSIAILSPLIEFEIKRKQAETMALRCLYKMAIHCCEIIRHMLMSMMNNYLFTPKASCHDTLAHPTLDMILFFSTPKLRSLFSYIQSKFSNKDPKEICCLIFVERRYTAKCLYFVVMKFIEATEALRDVLRPQFMIGRNSIAMHIENILDNKWNKKAIESFRTGECNLIICSNVLEEGIDVQACNYVFAFDQLKTFNSYIQTKGRARSDSSIYAIFSPKATEDATIKQVYQYNQIHSYIRSFLEKRVLDTDSMGGVQRSLPDCTDSFVTRGGARLLMTMAVKTLYQYCQSLPCDAFGIVQPWFSITNRNDGDAFIVALDLPMQSMLKTTIYSDPMETGKLGKMSAAFKACKLLYDSGELNDNLRPITKRECVANVSADLFPHWRKHNDDVTSKVAGKQYRRTYDRMCPEELFGALPVVGEPCYAYPIKITAHFAVNQSNADMHKLLASPATFALLLSKQLPRLAEMPLFMTQGRLTVKVSDTPIVCKIPSKYKLDQLRQFHYMIFRDLLEMWKNFFVVDKRNQEHSYLIVPFNETLQIDWGMASRFPCLKPQRPYSVAERLESVYLPEEWLGKVINKWYAGGDNERYVVTRVCTDLTPLSSFGTSSYQTYKEFFEAKYHHTIESVVHSDQFLVEVRQLTRRRNFFINAAGKNLKQSSRSELIMLVPELCFNFEFPGDMWVKALLLPSILHRLHFMLHADNLRRRFNAYLGLDTSITAVYHPQPLIIDKSLNRTMDADGNAIVEFEVEKKKVLCTLPTKIERVVVPVRDALPSAGENWKDYIEPSDYNRYIPYVYPIELDYYFQFVTGQMGTHDILSEYEESYTGSQLKMPRMRVDSVRPGDQQMLMPSGKPKIAILERTLGNIEITSAEQCEIVAALTAANANDVFDMERFELLGDSFLKFSVSLYLTSKYTRWHEGFLTEVKSKMVSNRNLLYCMLDLDIAERSCTSLFKPHIEWLPPLCSLPRSVLEVFSKGGRDFNTVSPNVLYNLNLSPYEVESGSCRTETLTQLLEACGKNTCVSTENSMLGFVYKESMADKVVADTLEALLGVCVKNYGIHHSFRMLEYFGICKAEDGDKPLSTLLDLNLRSPLLRTNIADCEVDGYLINYNMLESNLGYSFKDRAFLLQALTHPSYPTNRLTGCYQELEFVGDAILDFLVSCYIFEQHANMTPGKLTDFRSALVNNVTLACVCVRHRFHLFLLAESTKLSEAIQRFADFQETQHHRVTDQVRILTDESSCNLAGDEQETYNLSVNIDVPKALGDIVEALIAAVYLDSRDIKVTWDVIYHLLEQEFADFSQKVPIDAVRQLYEHPNANPYFSEPVVKNSTVMVSCTFMCLDNQVEVTAFGVNAKQAKKAAAKHAMQIIYKNI